jgi:integrase
MDALRLALADAPRIGPREPVFFSPRPNRQGVRDRLSRHSVSHALPRLLEGASLDALSAHGLRHAYATVALEAGIPIEAIAEQMGHRNPTMTRNRYAHVTPNLQRAALQIVNEAVKR